MNIRFIAAFLLFAGTALESFQTTHHESVAGTYSPAGVLRVDIPYRSVHAGAGELIVEVLDPEDAALTRAQRHIEINSGVGIWHEDLRLTQAVAVDDLVWHRLHYRFAYDDQADAVIEGTSSISQILRMPVIHILAQRSYLAGAQAAVRVMVTDSNGQTIAGLSSVHIELDSHPLFTGSLNERGTTETQFRFPAGLVGNHSLRYQVDTPIGSTEYTQPVRLEDKVSILLNTEKPVYQPGQTIHVRSLALDRSNHEAGAARKVTFELQDSRGNKVFKKITQTDAYGIASAEFGLAEEVNLGAYHLRAMMDEPDTSRVDTAEMALNVERYVLPKFKVAVDFGNKKHSYRSDDHVIGTVRTNYFFGKPVGDAEVTIKVSGMETAPFVPGSVSGKTDPDGAYRFDVSLASHFAGQEPNQGVAHVLVEATVKDSAGHSETHGETIAVSDSPLTITAIPEGGKLIPNLENQLFLFAAYPDGKPAKANLRVQASGNSDQSVASDDGGIAVIPLRTEGGDLTIRVDASDPAGNQASTYLTIPARQGQDQLFLRLERALYRAGDRILFKLLSTKKQGTVYVDLNRVGQTVLTRDVELHNGQAEFSLNATPSLAGIVDVNAYLFAAGRTAVEDHRMIFVQPADELKVEATADAKVYKPGDDARIEFRVTNSRGEGAPAALGLQVVDEAVFALAEQQPEFAKVFFYLQREGMKPVREFPKRDLAARALFAATGMVTTNKFEAEAGRDAPQTKYTEYAVRYQTRLQTQVHELAASLSRFYAQNPDLDLLDVMTKINGPETRDAWSTKLMVEYDRRFPQRRYYRVISAGPDKRFYTGDDASAYLEVRTEQNLGNPGTGSSTDVAIEHNRGPLNGLAEIVGSVADAAGAVVAGANVTLREVPTGKSRRVNTGAKGQFVFQGLSSGRYHIEVSFPGLDTVSEELTLKPQDRAVLSATLSAGSVSEVVVVENIGLPLGAGSGGGFGGGAYRMDGAGPPAASHVRTYFPEALYINPEIITDHLGRASIAIPMADSITTWRMAMLASTAHGALGSGASSIKVFKDFFVDLDLPVKLTQGDRVSIPVAIYNYSNAGGGVNLQLKSEDWFSLAGDVPAKTVPVESGRVGGSQFTLEAKRIGKFKLTLSARLNKEADIVVREIEVVPNGREQNLVFNGDSRVLFSTT